MPKIRFVRDTFPYEDSVVHEEGSVLECADKSAERWVRRGAARDASASAPKPKATPGKATA